MNTSTFFLLSDNFDMASLQSLEEFYRRINRIPSDSLIW